MRPVDGDRREDQAVAAGAAIGTVYSRAEAAIGLVLRAAARRSAATGMVTIAQMRRLRRDLAWILARAQNEARSIVRQAGVPWDWTPATPSVLPAPPPAAPPAASGGANPPGTPPATPPGSEPPPPAAGPVALPPPDEAPPPGAAGDAGPSIRELLDRVTVRVYRDVPDLFQQAVQEAIESTRGGVPADSTSWSRIQAAQKALDRLTGHGIKAFTDRAGREWSLRAYVEMATRTAVSNAYDNLQNTALVRAGHDLVLVYSLSPEGACPHCLPWIGKVLSLTGQTTGPVAVTTAAGGTFHGSVHATLAEARATGFRHPNCRCSMMPVVPGFDLAYVRERGVTPDAAAVRLYEASQVQRGYERTIRRLGRDEATATSPRARAEFRRRRIAEQQRAAEQRTRTGLPMTRAAVRRRQHPWNAR